MASGSTVTSQLLIGFRGLSIAANDSWVVGAFTDAAGNLQLRRYAPNALDATASVFDAANWGTKVTAMKMRYVGANNIGDVLYLATESSVVAIDVANWLILGASHDLSGSLVEDLDFAVKNQDKSVDLNELYALVCVQ